MGVLQTTIAEIVTVKEHQRMWSETLEAWTTAHTTQPGLTL